MIIKGKSRAAAGQAGNYLLDQKKNDRAELIEITNTLSPTVKGAMREWEAVASGSKCKDFVYHASINPMKGEHLTPEQWAVAVDLLAKNLGLEDHQRLVVEHERGGRIHRHILFNRVDPEKGKAVRMSHNFRAHELTARELEKRFDLEHTPGRHVLEKGEKPANRGPTHDEIKQAEKTGVNLYQWRAEIRGILAKELEKHPDANAHELAAALEDKGHILAQGDKRKGLLLILDPSGTPHRMAQSLNLKIRNGDFAEHFGDINPDTLPHVEQAQERQRERHAALDLEKEQQAKDRAGHLAATLYERGSMAAQQKDALRHIMDKIKKPQLTAREAFQKAHEQQTQQTQARENAEQQGRPQSGAIGKEKSQGEQRGEERKNRTEQTAEQIRQQQKEITREIFERNFGKGHNAGTLEKWGRDRGGRER